jgi:hypothetical protein
MVMCVLLCYKRGRHIRHLGLEACGNLTSNGVKRLAGLQELTHLNLNQVSPEGMGPALGRASLRCCTSPYFDPRKDASRARPVALAFALTVEWS